MASVLLLLVVTLPDSLRPRAALQPEVLALRHQLLVLHRLRRHRLRLHDADRLVWVWLSRLWTEWRSALVLVKPETAIGWHRQGFRRYWTCV